MTVRTTEAYRSFPTSFTHESSSFDRTCATEYGMPTLSKVEQHIFCNSILLSIRLVRVGFVPFFFRARSKG